MGEGTPAAEVDPAAYETTKAALGAKVIDDNTLELTLTHPAPYYPTIASLWVFYPAKKELIEQGGEDWWKDPTKQIGNGPFQMTEYAADQQVDFVANENYWGGRAKLDGIDIVYSGRVAVALEAYRAGDLDIVQVDPQQIPEIQADPELNAQLRSVPGGFDLHAQLQPDAGAVHRHQGPAGVLAGLRPRDLLRSRPQWRLRTDPLLDSGRAAGLNRV